MSRGKIVCGCAVVAVLLLAFGQTLQADGPGASASLLDGGRPSYIIYVNQNAEGADDGTSWENAFVELRDALEAASEPEGNLTAIWVAAGTYTPALPGTERSATFELIRGVEIYGGFAGYETNAKLRQPALHQTILSGDLNGDDGPGGSNRDDNCYHVLTAGEQAGTAVLDGLIITGGQADGTDAPSDAWGGGLLVLGGWPVLRDCWFTGNRANEGGAIYHTGERIFVWDSRFTDNWASEFGGAIYTEGFGITVRNSQFVENIAGSAGGAVAHLFGVSSLLNCLFDRNQASGIGGAVTNWSGELEAYRCLFRGNQSDSGAAWDNRGQGTALIRNALFTGNLAQTHGGAIQIQQSSELELVSSTLVGNGAANAGGGGIYSQDSALEVNGSIFWLNHDPGGTDESAQLRRSGGSLFIEYSCVQGWTGGLGNPTNIGDDPKFVDIDGPDNIFGTPDDNPTLDRDSPAANHGDPFFIPWRSGQDQAGHPRVLCLRVDMGAYEFGIGDYNCDELETLADFRRWEHCMTGPVTGGYPLRCEAFDFDGDGDVDLIDFDGFAQEYQYIITSPLNSDQP
jgi:predicted outer membrane repeat protein